MKFGLFSDSVSIVYHYFTLKGTHWDIQALKTKNLLNFNNSYILLICCLEKVSPIFDKFRLLYHYELLYPYAGTPDMCFNF